MTSKAYTGHQTSFVNMSREQIRAFGQAHAPAVVNPPKHKCSRCPEKTTLLRPSNYAKGRVCMDCFAALEWQSVLRLAGLRPTPVRAQKPQNEIGYDPTCGMQPLHEWRRDFLHLMFQQCRYERGLPGFRWAAEAYYLSIKTGYSPLKPRPAPSVSTRVPPKTVKAPRPGLPTPEKNMPKKKPLTLQHQRMVDQLGGNTEVMCAGGCGTDLGPRFKYAAESGTCPSVFIWKQDGKPYCGPCYGHLPYAYDTPTPAKPAPAPAKG